ncbi:translesion DNA synthesis-associated protein ImuA [Paraferrimonas haliotis]|uniref:Recombinase RecA n=1 Tax=Paraferrimonas haliotis TaxID=2013866 RepID=A0AA37WXE3_9GAMM|nr:translesion DNA synthesis-associated protein ImuA [Paraferrimonas haliotis]GLS84498.1 recombinase RecA [Paraferrimonas haliotis]
MKSDLSELLERHDVWRANQWQTQQDSYPTGFSELDKQLAGGGWPQVGVCQMICEQPGQGELQLFMPLLRHMASLSQWVVWLSPPAIPYAPSLAGSGVDLAQQLLLEPEDHKQALWALEQSVSSGACRLVFAWLTQLSVAQARRLQLAAEKGQCLLVLFSSGTSEHDNHPVQLKIAIKRLLQGSEIRIVKRRGGWPSAAFRLELGDSQWGMVKPEQQGQVIQGPW